MAPRRTAGKSQVREPRGGVGGEVNLSPVMFISSYVFTWSDLNALTTRVGGLVLVLVLLLNAFLFILTVIFNTSINLSFPPSLHFDLHSPSLPLPIVKDQLGHSEKMEEIHRRLPTIQCSDGNEGRNKRIRGAKAPQFF